MVSIKKSFGGLAVAIGMCAASAPNKADAHVYVGIYGSGSTFFNTSSAFQSAQTLVPGPGATTGILYLGLGGRVGFENNSRLYLAAEGDTNAIGSISNGTNKGFENPLISAGAALKIGYASASSAAKIYGIAFADYLMSLDTATKSGTVYVGGGVGIKGKVWKFLDVFMEGKASLPVAGVLDLTTVQYSHSESTSSVRLALNVGLDFHL